jgi:hypothetical protein
MILFQNINKKVHSKEHYMLDSTLSIILPVVAAALVLTLEGCESGVRIYAGVDPKGEYAVFAAFDANTDEPAGRYFAFVEFEDVEDQAWDCRSFGFGIKDQP